LSTSGENYERVRKRFNELRFFEETTEKGTLDEIPRDLG